MQTQQYPTRSPVTSNVPNISLEDFERVTKRIERDHGVDANLAARMLHGALDFLTMCSQHKGGQFTPPRPVDDAWHTLLLYSKAYAGFCSALGSRLWHEPNDGPIPHVGGYAKTLDFMKGHGIIYDQSLWIESAAGADSVPDPSTCGTDE